MSDFKNIITESFTQYAGAVLQSRALVDVRDAIKPSAREIFYALFTDKFLSSKPYQKTLKAVGSLSRFYIHGDASAVGVLMRAGQPFAMRYPLVSVHGNCGTLLESGNWAHQRYTESRLSPICETMFAGVDKDTITDWRDNYDNTEQYPSVLPSKGYYNIVNGTQGIAVGAASSIPQYNLRELNEALIYLIDHPDCTFEEIYCAPDFATGAILYNEDEVKASMKAGTGFACKLRSVVDFDAKERCFVVTEIPYGVYTNTICGELEEIVNGEDNPGIDRFNDLTGEKPLIKIYLTKKANPDQILRFLYKNTSLQYYYGINFTMLDQGRFPKVFTWKEMLQAHIDHERLVYRREFEFDLRKIESRIHIIDGLLICMARIEEVVQTIKASTSTAAASIALQEKFLLDEAQAKAVLDMKLSRLAHLEVKKLTDEREKLKAEAERIHTILNDEELFKNELKEGWRQVAKKFGDARRTKVISLSSDTNNEPIEVKSLQVSLTNFNNIFAVESSSLYTQKRGGVGSKLKMENGEYIITSQNVQSDSELLIFTQAGNYYHCAASAIPLGEKASIFNLMPLKEWETACAMTCVYRKPTATYILFFTKNGLVKKSLLSEYNITKNIGMKALVLDEGDEIKDIVFTTTDLVGILTELGNFIMIETEDIRPIGRATRGVRAIKLNDGDHVCGARAIPDDTRAIISLSGNGLFKQTTLDEFSIQSKNTKGSKLQKLAEGDWMTDFYPLRDETDITIVSTRSSIKLTIADVPTYSRGAQGNKSIKLTPTDNAIKIIAS